MSDVLEVPTNEPLAVEQLVEEPQTTAEPKVTQNLIQNHKRLSLLMQIYNWQPTGQCFRIKLPMQVSRNYPLLAIEVTPLWIPLHYWCSVFSSNPTYNYCMMKPWLFPVSVTNTLQTIEPPTGISYIEKDNMPDIAWFALHHAAWSGGLDYMFRVVSNTTTQGKLSFSRAYDVVRHPVGYNPTKVRGPLHYAMNSITSRQKNAFAILDLSRTSDLQLHLPYIQMTPIKRPNMFNFQQKHYSIRDTGSYLFVDVVDILDKSAGSDELIVDIWMKASPDFKLHHPMPLSIAHSLTAPERFGDDTTPLQFIDNAANFTPVIFGANSNVTFDAQFKPTLPYDY